MAAPRVRHVPVVQKKPRNMAATISVLIVLGLMVALAAMMMRPSEPEPELAEGTTGSSKASPRSPQSPPTKATPRVALVGTDSPAPIQPDAPVEDEPEPNEPEPEAIIEDGPLAFMIDAGGTFTRYDGANSPAHAEEALPGSYTNWITANHGKANGGQPQDVQTAAGVDYPNPLRIELGCEEFGKSDLDALRWSAEIEAGDPPSADGIFGSDLMDGVHSQSGNKTIGLRVSGMEAGKYALYFSPVTGVNLDSSFEYAIGIDSAADSSEIDRLGSPGLKAYTYEADSAKLDDPEWVLDQNYVKHEVEIAGPDDYVVALVALARPKSAFMPYLQIVKIE
jgi:hypothetical protein